MTGHTLLVLGLLCGAALGGPLNGQLDPDQMNRFLEDVLFQAKRLMVTHMDLSNVNIQLNKVLFGLPIELALVSHNTTLQGPFNLELYGNVVGEQHENGLVLVSTEIGLGDLEVRFPYFLIDLFGFKEEGSAQMTLMDARVDLSIHIYKNILTSCQATASVSKPTGALLFTFGQDGSWTKAIMSAVEYALSKTVIPHWIIGWAFFPDVASHLEYAFEEAAKIVSCR